MNKNNTSTIVLKLIMLAFLILATSINSSACPTISKYNFVDINCNQEFRLLFTGDSIVRGVGDELHENQWGYVERIQQKFRKIDVQNLGVPGNSSHRLLQDFRQNLNKKRPGTTIKKSRYSDAVIIAVGVNDFWERLPVSFTIRNIRRLVKLLRNKLKFQGEEPEIFVATILPVAPVSEIRIQQSQFVEELNSALLRYNSRSLPVYLNLNEISPSVLGEDGLHPTSHGYDVISDFVLDFIDTDFLKKLKLRHRDHDKDGIYDTFEEPLFGTSKYQPDTDGDGYLDGVEVFELLSDPLDGSSPGVSTP